jgi:hypothetical protein
MSYYSRTQGQHFGGVPQHAQTTPRASSHPNTARISAQNLSLMAKRLGRCGDINPVTGYVCVTQPHDDEVEHMAVQIGGPNDGKVYSSWGGTKVRAT